ncbi:MAG: AraC family transcriptional regulator [Burkholderiales bacterium]
MDRHLTFATSQDLWVKPLQCVPVLLREFHVRSQTVFRRAQVSRSVLGDPRNRLDFAQVGQLLVECVVATGCEHFGLLVGQRAGPETAGIIHELMLFTKTVRSALYALRSHLHLHDRGGVLAITEQSSTLVELAYVVFRPNTPGAGQISDGALAILFLLLRSLCGSAWKPVAVTIAHRRPVDVTPYRRLFQAPVSFDAPRSALVVPAALLEHQLLGADARTEAALEAVIADAEAAHPLSFTLQVKRVVAAMLVGCAPSFPQIATALEMSARTVRRRLADEGTTVTSIVDETKAEFARQLIVETRMSIHEIAQTLHYTKPGAFSRAYVGWMGVTPRAARNAALRGATVARSNRRARPVRR